MNGLHCGRMSTEPQPAPRRWGVRETTASVAVAAVIAVLGGAAIYAATAGDSHAFGAPHQPFGPAVGMSGGQHGAGGGPGPAAIGASSLHGEFVVADGAGGYTTELTQTGTVTAISTTSITVRSEDGYRQTYAIPNAAGSAGAPFAVDDQVVVRATRNGQTATVTTIGNPPQGGASGSGGPPPHQN
jgi:hypothetical protein